MKYKNVFNVYSHHPLEKVPTESAQSALSNFVQTAGRFFFVCLINT